jgi:hypothetical protein
MNLPKSNFYEEDLKKIVSGCLLEKYGEAHLKKHKVYNKVIKISITQSIMIMICFSSKSSMNRKESTKMGSLVQE